MLHVCYCTIAYYSRSLLGELILQICDVFSRKNEFLKFTQRSPERDAEGVH